ncbi:uncharacterized protein BDZ99DRAFT_5930 [Mytilinidion resinicola]|uniref:Transcription factor domain-containing protein n=1 Tax=Mytilinidion resinicola TaxID=574789 RepID=A0A6A6Z798_9PEZI|nr:uncharacterized protein BDZ99DRAFT_5930 [Mytilinidion resinicola]KAF2816972.1 hypothetical protein BDZ99DRAFT_5930 [Mytilinidion resinicola]
MCDALKHFTFEVPQRARSNITLFNAIMALSARHLSRTSSFNTFVADRYYQTCLQTLIPALNDSVAINDESLLAATIILRLLEELNIPITGDDPRSHLFGTHAILRAVQRRYDLNPVDTSFRQAIYWAAFRQELWISLMTQRPFQLHIFEADRSIEPANDSTWADRTIAHVGDVIHFAFGEGKHSISRFNRLMEENESWRKRRPDSFVEFFYRRDRDGSGRNFPDIRCHADAHVMGRQYNILARVLLVVHNPTIPQLGPAHKKAKMEVDIQVQEDVRTLVGVALSNERAFPASLVACFAIALVGDRFTNRQDQSQLREMLIKTETRHGWPTKAARSQLEEVWEWNGH